MKNKIVMAMVAAGLLFSAQANADPDPWDVGNVNTGAFGQGAAYFDTTITVAAGGDSVSFGFLADQIVIMQGVRADSGWVTVRAASNAANNLSGGIRTGLDRFASAGMRLMLAIVTAEGDYTRPKLTFSGKSCFSGVSVIPGLAAPNKVIIIQAWRG